VGENQNRKTLGLFNHFLQVINSSYILGKAKAEGRGGSISPREK
jgi:hypothetical protein